MTKKDSIKKTQAKDLTSRQIKAIPHLIDSPTLEEGRKKARVSKNALYQWLKNPIFKKELATQRDILIAEAFETLKSSMTKATETLVGLLDVKSEGLRRRVCNDILGHVLKFKEVEDLEKRITKLEEYIRSGRY